jgi:hypothetical protein
MNDLVLKNLEDFTGNEEVLHWELMSVVGIINDEHEAES